MGLKVDTIQNPSSATVNLTLDTSGNATVGNNLTVTGTSTFTGSLGNITAGTVTASGLVTGATGALYPVVQGTAQASTSGTSIDFTGIPSWVKRITINFSGVSTNGVSNIQVQIGSITFTTTGYAAGAMVTSSAGLQAINNTTGFPLESTNSNLTATSVRNGSMQINLVTGNTWVSSSAIGYSAGATYVAVGGGSVALGGALDRLRITTVAGDTFDAGTINIQYE